VVRKGRASRCHGGPSTPKKKKRSYSAPSGRRGKAGDRPSSKGQGNNFISWATPVPGGGKEAWNWAGFYQRSLRRKNRNDNKNLPQGIGGPVVAQERRKRTKSCGLPVATNCKHKSHKKLPYRADEVRTDDEGRVDHGGFLLAFEKKKGG